jgi:His/Glu/Gln/Arg/opine family amino acid ABC transporter permease subunit
MTFIEQISLIWNLRGKFFESLGFSLFIALFAAIMGFVIGVLLAMVRIAPKNNILIKALDKVAGLYITVIRGTPMIAQLLIMYSVVLASLKYSSNNLIVPIIAFGINSGAYMAEVIRGGISSVDVGQMEAGRSLGLSWTTVMFRVVIPQAVKVVVPAIFNELISLVKETSVIYIIVLRVNDIQKYDLLGYADKMGQHYAAAYFAFLVTASLLYLSVVLLLTLVQRTIERRFKKNER